MTQDSLQAMRLPTKIQPNEVRGFLGGSEADPPDRKFNVLDIGTQFDCVWELDGYRLVDEVNHKELWKIHLVCPKCQQLLTIDSEKKAIYVTEDGLEVEEFRCSWAGDFGGQCTFTAGIVLPGGKDKIVVTEGGHRRRIDGVFKHA